MIYTYDELKKFEEVIDRYGTEKVLDVAVASYVCGDFSPTILLKSIRNDSVEELFETLPKLEDMNEKEKKGYFEVKEHFINIISQNYNKA